MIVTRTELGMPVGREEVGVVGKARTQTDVTVIGAGMVTAIAERASAPSATLITGKVEAQIADVSSGLGSALIVV